MSQVSKYPVNKEVEERISQLFQSAITKLHSTKDVEEFLNDFLSPVEKVVLAKRLAIALLLSKGYGYSSIQDILKVTYPTIASVSVTLKYGGKGYKKLLSVILQDEKSDAFWGKFEDILTSLPPGRGDTVYSLQDRFEKKQSRRRKPF
ncbi:MAG: hypothetical protein HYV40_02230 [Candidatus Levybacteria bacterium]|nr:hypothetical protein [Candidatus Levybacteria bacterium]